MRNKGKKLKKKMGRAPCCNKGEVKKGAWTPEEDKLLVDYITNNGYGTWRSFPKAAGLRRCGKSCRLRWTNYLRPDIKRGAFNFEEEQTIFNLHSLYGNKWATIASRLPGRTDNEIKNFWNSHLRKRIPKSNLPSMSTNVKPKWKNTKEEPEPEPETMLSVDPMFLSPETVLCDGNNILHEWGSSDGEPFQKLMEFDKMACEIPTLRAIKFESDFVDTVQTGTHFTVTSTSESCDHGVQEQIRFKEEAEEIMNASESQNSYEAENGSDITLDLLLDFPNDGEYLQYV